MHIYSVEKRIILQVEEQNSEVEKMLDSHDLYIQCFIYKLTLTWVTLHGVTRKAEGILLTPQDNKLLSTDDKSE